MYLAHHTVEVAAELVDPRLIACRDEDTWRVSLRNPALFEVVERHILLRCGSEVILLLGSICIGINLIEYQECGLIARAYICEGLLNNGNLILEAWVRDVNDMEQQICLAHLIQCRLKRLDKLRGELADEAYGVGHKEWEVVEYDLAHRGIECRKELILREYLTLRELVHKRRLTHIGITHQCHTHHLSTV